MKLLLASFLIAALPFAAQAQSQAQGQAPAAKKPAAQPAAKKTAEQLRAEKARAERRAAVRSLTPNQKQAIETLAPLEEADPTIKLDERDLAVAKIVHVGQIACELGSHIEIRALKREGFFLVKHRASRFVMHPVFSRTGAVRLEDPVRGAVWLQLANKSMLMNQKEGKRLADECQSPSQLDYAKNMKPVDLLAPAPQEPATVVATPVAPAPAITPQSVPAPTQ